MQTKTPNIFEYIDFKKYLLDYYELRHSQDKNFSKSEFARLVFNKNKTKDQLKHRGYLNDILTSRSKVTDITAGWICDVLGLDKVEAVYFKTLVSFCQASNPNDREMHFNHLISLNRSPNKILDVQMLPLYSEWHHSVIRAIIDVFDFSDNYSALAKSISPPITEKKAKDSIQFLLSLGLIKKNESGFWKPTEKSISAPLQKDNELLVQYQLSLLEFAKESLLKNHCLPQNITTNTISISDDAFNMLRDRLEKFRSDVRSIITKDDKPATKVYQLNTQLFPVYRSDRQ